jgi:hypothetical protein
MSSAPAEAPARSLTPYTVVEADGVSVECFPVSLEEGVLKALVSDIYEKYWDRIHFGTHVQGAVWEIAIDKPPERIGMLDGYLTVDFGLWHCHLCIGEHKGTKGRPIDPELARIRRTSRAEFFRRLKADGAPNCWGFQMFNGVGEVQMTVFFPNPYLDSEGKIRHVADWDKLAMWDDLRLRHAGIAPDSKDRSSTGFVH